MISTTSAQSTTKAIQTKFVIKHKFGQNKMLPNWKNTEETTKQHQIEKHLRKSKHSQNLTPINLVHLIAHTKGWLGISDTQARVSVWTPARPFDKVVKCPTCQINHPACLDCLFEILQKKDPSEVGNMARMEMYSINTRDPKGVKIRKQAARDGVQFNFILPEGVPSSCTPLGNTGESMVVGLERIDQTPPKSQASKPAEGLSPIGVKKDGSNLPVCNAGGQGLVFCSPNVIPTEPTPPKGPLL